MNCVHCKQKQVEIARGKEGTDKPTNKRTNERTNKQGCCKKKAQQRRFVGKHGFQTTAHNVAEYAWRSSVREILTFTWKHCDLHRTTNHIATSKDATSSSPRLYFSLHHKSLNCHHITNHTTTPWHRNTSFELQNFRVPFPKAYDSRKFRDPSNTRITFNCLVAFLHCLRQWLRLASRQQCSPAETLAPTMPKFRLVASCY